MNSPSSKDPERLEGFAGVVRQLQAPLSASERSMGWRRLQQGLISLQRPEGEISPGRWWQVGWRLPLTFAAVLVLAAAVAWSALKPAVLAPAFAYEVSGEGPSARPGVAGRRLEARKAPLELRFTDGSRIALRRSAAVTVTALEAAGSEVRVHDGVIDVAVRHQAETAWRFEAGPYLVRVTGTSFSLGWDERGRTMRLDMRSGSVELAGPGGAPRRLGAGESLSLDEAGNAVAAATAGDDATTGAPRSVGPPVEPGPGEPAAALPRAAPVAAASSRAAGTRRGPEHRLARPGLARVEWAALLARGEFEAIVGQARGLGIDLCLASGTESNLAALADAARYTHRRELARGSLLALRSRFAGTEHARDATFFLARLSEATGPREALSWYERYLEEGAGPGQAGSYAEEALGREMILLRRDRGGGDGPARARAVAGRYLAAYPRGIYAADAAGLLQAPSAR